MTEYPEAENILSFVLHHQPGPLTFEEWLLFTFDKVSDVEILTVADISFSENLIYLQYHTSKERWSGIGRRFELKEMARMISKRLGHEGLESNIFRLLILCEAAKVQRSIVVTDSLPHDVVDGISELFRGILITSVSQGLGILGAFVRRKNRVYIGGNPLECVSKDKAYLITALMASPGFLVWKTWVESLGPNVSESKNKLHLEAAICHEVRITLVKAVFGRIAQAIRGRDEVMERLRFQPPHIAVSDASFYLDSILLSGMGVLDALAKVADEIHGLESDSYNIAWQKSGWVNKLKYCAPNLWKVANSDGDLWRQLKVVREMRNNIHGVPLEEYRSTLISIPMIQVRIERRLLLGADLSHSILDLKCSDQLESLGIYLEGQSRLFLNPKRFADAALRVILDIAARIMMAMLTDARKAGIGKIPKKVKFNGSYLKISALTGFGDYPEHKHATGVLESEGMHKRFEKYLQPPIPIIKLS